MGISAAVACSDGRAVVFLFFMQLNTVAADRSFTSRDIESGAMQLNTEVCPIGKLSRRGFYLAFQNSGACVAMVSVRVYYKTCPEAVRGLARFPETLAGSEGLTEVPGVCVEYAAEEVGSPPRMHCSTDGEWLVPVGRCLCAVGFEEVDGSCVGEYADTSCRPWERFQRARDQSICKQKVGSGELVWSTSPLPTLCIFYLSFSLPSPKLLFFGCDFSPHVSGVRPAHTSPLPPGLHPGASSSASCNYVIDTDSLNNWFSTLEQQPCSPRADGSDAQSRVFVL